MRSALARPPGEKKFDFFFKTPVKSIAYATFCLRSSRAAKLAPCAEVVRRSNYAAVGTLLKPGFSWHLHFLDPGTPQIDKSAMRDK